MKGILKEIKKVECKAKNGSKFTKIEFICDVKVNDKGDVKTLRGSYGEDFARKYFAFCNVKTKDLVGKEVGCTLSKRQYENNGERRIISYIKYLNILDKEGNAILIPKEDSGEDLDF